MFLKIIILKSLYINNKQKKIYLYIFINLIIYNFKIIYILLINFFYKVILKSGYKNNDYYYFYINIQKRNISIYVYIYKFDNLQF